MLAYAINETTVTCIIDGQVKTIQRDHPQVGQIIKLLKTNASEKELLAMFDRLQAIRQYMSGSVEVRGNKVYFQDCEVHNTVADRILQFMAEDLPYEPLIEFLKCLMNNPSYRAVNELYDFLKHEGLPITKYGTFLAYKGVCSDSYSVHGNETTKVLKGTVDSTGHIYNGIGEDIIVDRKDVDDNRDRTCSEGLHAGSHAYASTWGAKVVIVEINPADVVSVPSDHDGQKVRVCRYKVVGECAGVMRETMADTRDPYRDTRELAEDDDEDAINARIAAEREEAYKDGYTEGLEAAQAAIDEALEDC
jgi:hypothetical protein